MEETKPAIEWHKFKDKHVAIRGEEILAIIDPVEGFPCEAYGMNVINGMFSTVEAAKSGADKAIAKFLERVDHMDDPPQNFYLDILKQIVAALETKAKPVE